jgi:hypothetical protein
MGSQSWDTEGILPASIQRGCWRGNRQANHKSRIEWDRSLRVQQVETIDAAVGVWETTQRVPLRTQTDSFVSKTECWRLSR